MNPSPDHLEVVWDLDNEAAQRSRELGMGFARAATPNPDARFAELVVDLVREHATGDEPRKLSTFPAAGCTLSSERGAVRARVLRARGKMTNCGTDLRCGCFHNAAGCA